MRSRRYKSSYRRKRGRGVIVAAAVVALCAACAAALYFFPDLLVRVGLKKPAPTPVPTVSPSPSPSPTPQPDLRREALETQSGEAHPYYRLSVSVADDLKSFDAACQITYVNTSANELSELALRYFPNALEKKSALPVSQTGAFRSDTPKARITRVLENASAAEYAIEGKYSTTLRVKLAAPLPAGESTEITVAYTQELPDANYALGSSRGAAQLSWFYPAPAQLEAAEDGTERFSITSIEKDGAPWYISTGGYDAVISAPAQAAFASTGTVIQTEESNKRATYYVKAENARDFALALSNGKKDFKLEKDGVIIKCCAGTLEKAKLMANLTRGILQSYGELLSPFAGELEIMQCALRPQTATASGLVFVDSATVTGKQSELEFQLAAAIAKLWLGGSIGGENKFNQTLAEYCAVCHFARESEDKAAEMAQKSKGAQALIKLRDDLGAIEFDQAFKTYLQKGEGTRGDAQEFLNCFEQRAQAESALKPYI